MVLKREKGKTSLPPYQGDVEAFSRMSCFAATEDDGLLGIKEGKVFACTSLVKPARLWGERAVYVCEAKGLYAILTEKGRLVTNVEFCGKMSAWCGWTGREMYMPSKGTGGWLPAIQI